MNDYDYAVFEKLSLLIGSLSLIIGGYLLSILGLLSYINSFFLILIFLICFFVSFFFFCKRQKYEHNMNEEIKKYLKDNK